jgi:hypothetical protein
MPSVYTYTLIVFCSIIFYVLQAVAHIGNSDRVLYVFDNSNTEVLGSNLALGVNVCA